MVEPYPSEKWWSESQLGWWNSQSMESNKIHVPKHQPEIIVAKWYPKIGNTMEIPQNLAMLENFLNPGVWGGVTLMTCFGMNGGLQPQMMWIALNWWNKAYRSKFKVYQTISDIQMVKRQWGIVYGFPKAHGCPHCPTDPKASKLAVGTWLVRPRPTNRCFHAQIGHLDLNKTIQTWGAMLTAHLRNTSPFCC